MSRDDELHWKFACAMFSTLHHRPPPSVVQQIVVEAVECEKRALSEGIKFQLVGELSQVPSFVEYKADQLLKELGQNRVYNVENPFSSWMTSRSETCHRVTEYSRSNSAGRVFSLDADF